METLKTVLHVYRFSLDVPEERAQYRDLIEKLRALGLRKFSAISHNDSAHHAKHIKPLDGQPVTLETSHLFNDQWNSAPTETSESGLRLMDWNEPYNPHNRKFRYGYWLEQTPEMREIRRNTNACGYCANQEPAAKGTVFCGACLGSEYLKPGDLHLTRMRAIDDSTDRGPLSDAERAHIMPLYEAAQAETRRKRATKKRADLIESRDAKIANARTECDGFLWLIDNGLPWENCIFYPHTGVFCFGWQTPLGEAETSAILDVITEFPHPYQIKTSHKGVIDCGCR